MLPQIANGNSPSDIYSVVSEAFQKSGIKYAQQWLDKIAQPVPNQDAIAFVGADGTFETWQKVKMVRTAADTPHQGKDADKDIARGYTYLAPAGAGDKIFKPQLIPEAVKAIEQQWGVELTPNWVWKQLTDNPDVPIYVTEGLKKALALNESGYPAVSLYGVRCGIDKKTGEIKPNVAALIPPGKTVILVFDEDEKPATRAMVETQTQKWARAIALMGEGRKLKVCHWDSSLGKGIDDVLFDNGVERLRVIIGGASSIEVTPVSDYKVKTAGQIVFENVFKHGNWVCLNGTLYQFNGDYYVLRSDEYVLNLIQKFTNCYQVIRGGLKTTPLATDRNDKEGLTFAKKKLYTDPGEINPPGYLNLANCVLKIGWEGSTPSWKALPKSGDIKFTYPGTVKYDPAADPKMCDRLLSALDPEPREILLRVLAGALDLPKVRALRGRAVRTLFLWGAGSNGKDAIRETVAQILGGYGMGAISLAGFAQYDAGRKFPLANLPNYRVNWSSESGEVDVDGLQSLKAAQTGDVLQCERKGKDETEFTPNTVFIFNTNQPPKMTGSFNSSSSRYAVIQFSKTFKDNPSAPGEIQADPRFKNDPRFITEQVAPAFLNYLLAALTRVAADGIDYSPLDQTLREVRSRASHLLEFFDDIGLGLCEGSKVTVSELWDKLREHYVDVGTLKIDDTGREIWSEINGCDRPVKSKAVLAAKLLEAFPTVTKVKQKNKTVQTTYFMGLGLGGPSGPIAQPKHVMGPPSENLTQSGFQKSGGPSGPSGPIFLVGEKYRVDNIAVEDNSIFLTQPMETGVMGPPGPPNSQKLESATVTPGGPTIVVGPPTELLGPPGPQETLQTGIRLDPDSEQYQIVGTNYSAGSIEALLVNYLPGAYQVTVECYCGEQESVFGGVLGIYNLLQAMRIWFGAAIKTHRWTQP
jgi:phage/plasmid-associated DNA primase